MVQTARAPAGTADPMSTAVVSPEASLVARELLEMALANSAAVSPTWEATLQALLANVLMNDYLNWWNDAGPDELNTAKVAADRAINLNASLPLGYQARGLVRRAEGDAQGASDDFEYARSLDSSFARAYAQAGNQKALRGQPQNSHGDFANARNLAPRHRAIGYFDWGEGRAYFQQAIGSNAQADWSNAIDCLTKSVKELPTVWYNRCYLAAAQNNAGDQTGAHRTINDFINDPRFNQATFTRIKQLKPDPKDPARQRVLDFVQPLLP
jgi:hypothetical protein